MNLLFDNWIIKIIGKSSKHDLDRIVKAEKDMVILLGEDRYWEEIFLLYVNDTTGDIKYWIAIFSECSVSPSILTLAENNIFIGFNNQIKIINLSLQKIIVEKDLLSTFFFAKHIEGKLFVISEIDVLVLNEDYEDILKQSTDIIESFEFTNRLLIYRTHSGIYRINIPLQLQ